MNYKIGDEVIIARKDNTWASPQMDILLGTKAIIRKCIGESGPYFCHLNFPEDYEGNKYQEYSFTGEGFDIANDGDVKPVPVEIIPDEAKEPAQMKIKYKNGDKVICFDVTGKRDIVEGGIYLVKGCTEKCVTIINEAGNSVNYVVGRFKKATPAIIKAYKDKAAKDLATKIEAEKKAKKDEAEAFNKRTEIARKAMYMEAREHLKKIAPIDGRVSCYAIVYKDNVDYNPNPHCHASIAGNEGRVALIDDIAYHLVHNPKLKEKEEQYRDWINYVMNEGPRSNCFIRQGVEAALQNGVVYNSDRPIEEIIGACNQLREGSEYHERLHLFTILRKKGFSGNVCYLLSYCVSSDMKFVGFDNIHKSMHDSMEVEQTFKFFREGYFLTKDKKAYNKSSNGYNFTIAAWAASYAKPGETSINTFFKERLTNSLIKPAGFGAKSEAVTMEALLTFATVLEPLVNKF